MPEKREINSIADFLNHIDSVRARLNNRSEWVTGPYEIYGNFGWSVQLRVFLGPSDSYTALIAFYSNRPEGSRWGVMRDGDSDNRLTGMLNGWKRDDDGVMRPVREAA